MTQHRKDDPPEQIISGVPYFTCSGATHDGPTLLPQYEFYFHEQQFGGESAYRYRIRKCRACLYAAKYFRTKRAGKWNYVVHGKVPLWKMQKYLEEIEARAGGVNKAAKQIGVSYQTMLLWQGRSRWHEKNQPIKNMTRTSALQVLLTLRRLRDEQVGVEILYTPFKKRKGYCSGCGGREDARTADCHICTDRHNRWARRGKPHESANDRWGIGTDTARTYAGRG